MINQEFEDSLLEPFLPKSNVQTVTLGMGCFWSPEALFGHLPGVVRTCVGYAGGSSLSPTYREMGDHSETVQLDFDSTSITLDVILNLFWDNHNPSNINGYKGRQYHSLLLYRDETQKEAIQRVLSQRQEQGKGEPATEIVPFIGFHQAEERHQKYYLKRYPNAIEKLRTLYATQDELEQSTLAARLNGLAKGYTSLERIINEIKQWSISPSNQSRLIALIRQIRW